MTYCRIDFHKYSFYFASKILKGRNIENHGVTGMRTQFLVLQIQRYLIQL